MNQMITVAKNSNTIDFIQYAYSLGVRDFRLNMDYEEEAQEALKNIISLNIKNIRIFADFQGVKMRIQLSPNENDVKCIPGQHQTFYTSSIAYPYITNFNTVSDFIKSGDIMNIADGKIKGKVLCIDEQKIEIEYLTASYVLRQNAGCSFEGNSIPPMRMTNDACNTISKSKIILNGDIQWVILSFVDSALEIIDFVNNMHSQGIKVMAKIETANGVKNIEEISKVCDGFMIGRGDLKNTSSKNYSILYQEALEKVSNYRNKYNGVGTFFLSSFSQTGEISDEEINDVLNVKNHGFGYVMLSKEVVNSKFPYETIELLQNLCDE